MEETTVYDIVGGQDFFERLVAGFYHRVATDELLRPMYPDELDESQRVLVMFLAQYWGGPRDYLEERGHPRLRMRHVPFHITKRARDAWLSAMMASLDDLRSQLPLEVYDDMAAYFEMAANSLRNV